MKQKNIRKLAMYFLLFVFIFKMNAYAEGGLSIKYDGEVYEYERFPKAYIDGIPMKSGAMPAFITKAGRTLVPVREFCETLEGDVQWNDKDKEVYILCQNNFIVLKIDDYIATVNGEEVKMDETAKLVENMSMPGKSKAMVPLRFLLEALKYRVDWNQEDYAIMATKIDDPNPQPEPEQPQEPEVPTVPEKPEPKPPTDTDLEQPKGKLKDYPVIFKGENKNPIEEELEQQIPYAEYGITDITDAVFVNEVDGQLKFIVSATSPISGVKTTIWNNKLILDIRNANRELEEETVLLENNPYFTAIRSSQFSKDPLTTRIVLDLKYDDIMYGVKLTSDRKNIILTVNRNYIHEIKVGADNKGEYAEITGTQMPVLNVLWLANPTRLVLDVPYSDSAFIYKEALADGEFVESVRTSKFNEETVRVVLQLKKPAEFFIENVNAQTQRVRLMEPTYKNINYEITNGVPQLVIKKIDPDIKGKSFKIEDDYLNKKAIVTIPYMGLDELYGFGKLHVNDDTLKDITLDTDNRGFHITFDTKIVKGYKVVEDDEYYYIQLLRPQQVYDKILVLDPGHGGSDPGKPKGAGNVAGINEKEANIKISLEIYQLLTTNTNIKVYMTRFDDTYPTLQERAQLANEVEADLFISVHNNAFSSSFHGTETLYFGGNNSITKELAYILQNSTYTAVNTKNRGLRYRDDLYVLNHTKMPAILVEVAYMTSPIDGPRLNDPNFISAAAKGIYNGIVESFDVLKKKNQLN